MLHAFVLLVRFKKPLIMPGQRKTDTLPIYLDNDASRSDAIMVRLLDACVQGLRERGMGRMYIDAAKTKNAGFQSIGAQRMVSTVHFYSLLTFPQASKNGPDTGTFGGMYNLHSFLIR